MVRVGERTTLAACPSKVSLEDFKDWLTVLLDVDKPISRLSLEGLEGGDILITDPHRNKIYNMGLLLLRGDDQHGFLYGYNFLAGTTLSDRSELLDSRGKRNGMPYRFIHRLWRDIIYEQKRDLSEPEIDAVQLYTKVLNEHQDGIYAQDAALAEQYVEQDTSKIIWTRLLSTEPEAFYFPLQPDDTSGGRHVSNHIKNTKNGHGTDSDQDKEIIQIDLAKTPIGLSPKLWSVLRKSGNFACLTPTEYRQRKFDKCVKLEYEETVAGTTKYDVMRALYAALALHDQTAALQDQTIFVAAQDLRIGCTYDRQRSIARVHSKWLSPSLPRQEDDIETEIARISACDETANDIYSMILSEAAPELGHTKLAQLRNAARNAIANITYNVTIKPGPLYGSLQVSWLLVGERRIALGASGVRLLVSLHTDGACRESKESRPSTNVLFQQRKLDCLVARISLIPR